MSEPDSGIRRRNLSLRLINVLESVTTKRRPVTTAEVISDLYHYHAEDCCYRTVFRCLESWEELNFIKRIDAKFVGDNTRWIGLKHIKEIER